MRTTWVRARLAALLILSSFFAKAQLQKSTLGDFRLENGETIKECFLTYRVFGRLNAKKNNVIVLLTWFNGNSKDLIYITRPGGWADSSKYYVIIIDALGDGNSSSPSNSIQQPQSAFPRFSIRDMVHTQHKLLNEKLNLKHVFALGGISMGGFQVFQWIVSYPDFMDKAVIIEGTPKPTAYDRIFYSTDIKTIEIGLGNKDLEEKSYRAGIDLLVLNGWTPDYVRKKYKPNEVDSFLSGTENEFMHFNVYDWVYQMRAIDGHDIFQEKPVEEILKIVKAKYFVVVNKNDHVINPNPAKSFAETSKAKFLELTDDCGHLSFVCQDQVINEAVVAFLNE